MNNKFDKWIPQSLRALFLLVALLLSTTVFSQKSGEEIVRIKNAYYGRNTQKVKKQNTKSSARSYSAEECFDKGLDLVNRQEFPKAMEWLLKGAAQNDGPCELLCGMAYDGGRIASQDYRKAVDYYRRAANKGIKEAMTYLGRCYYEAKGVTRDYQQAYYWLKKGADLGDANAFSDLGNYYRDGDAVEPNFNLAAQYYEAAAKAGETRGQGSLAFCYIYGEGKPQNTEMALYWMTKAAEKGDSNAMAFLGGWYILDKYGIPVNTMKSIYWLEKAAAEGNDFANQYLPQVRQFAQNLKGISNAPISINDLFPYNIVVGSYSIIDNARNLCQKVRDDLGYADIYYDVSTRLYRIICFMTQIEQEAVNQLNSATIKNKYPDSWILQVANGKAVEYKK